MVQNYCRTAQSNVERERVCVFTSYFATYESFFLKLCLVLINLYKSFLCCCMVYEKMQTICFVRIEKAFFFFFEEKIKV